MSYLQDWDNNEIYDKHTAPNIELTNFHSSLVTSSNLNSNNIIHETLIKINIIMYIYYSFFHSFNHYYQNF